MRSLLLFIRYGLTLRIKIAVTVLSSVPLYPPLFTALGPSFAVRFSICFLYKTLCAFAFLRMAFAIAFCSSVKTGSVLSTTIVFFFSSFKALFAKLASDFLCFALWVFLFTPFTRIFHEGK